MADDLNFQQMSTVQNNLQLGPKTLASAATIAPTTFLTFLTGTTAVATITPPVTGSHLLGIVSSTTNHGGFLTTGNILVASVTNSTNWLNRLSLFAYNPITGKYYPAFAVLS